MLNQDIFIRQKQKFWGVHSSTYPWGGPRVSFRLENESRENPSSHTPIDPIFHAGSKNKIIFRRNTSLFSENLMNMSQNLKNCWLDTFVVKKILGGQIFLTLENVWFCSFWKGLSDAIYENFGTFNFSDQISFETS